MSEENNNIVPSKASQPTDQSVPQESFSVMIEPPLGIPKGEIGQRVLSTTVKEMQEMGIRGSDAVWNKIWFI